MIGNYVSMQLHKDKHLFEAAIRSTSKKFGIPEIYIEKDYWVTNALKSIFESEIASEAVFKGGTSLSKCFGMIERFSEDIDIVVIRKEGESDNQMKKKIRLITKIVSGLMPEVEQAGITQKRGQIRKTAHQYLKNFTGVYGQVREQIILEASWLGNSEPFFDVPIGCMIAEMMRTTNNDALIKKYQLTQFNVQVLHPNRTFCEKIMSLVRFSYAVDPIRDLGHKVRHIYDLKMMLENPEIAFFFDSADFDTMLRRVGWDDQQSFRNNHDWVHLHPSKAIIFANAAVVWHSISKVYRHGFGNLVYGDLPPEDQLLIALNAIFRRISNVSWSNLLAG